ncbi:hypothetical protein FPY71_02940 [Aureimonas fodinaquatilis]|uniref:Spy/CpxP family protein refolding chaperone n=1 Tax=Aureimonas fodinaquatilis TaxID=2565783 RepID=A0A5B0DZ43_9HYPH|nr:Spy/CpxP family protein refolding chaperone [Aureimonas fodinaquatilis]KAA0972087.1 hypothetical protein FPY71_02940 [Aureimonas fodinaquatilis]
MKPSSRLVAATLAVGMILPGVAFAQAAGPKPTPPHAQAQADGQHNWKGNREKMRGHQQGGQSGLWAVSTRLAAAELALGITPEQQDAWRGLTSAVIAYVEAGRPGPARTGESAPESADTSADGLATSRSFQRVERMLERRVQQGQAAQELQGAITTLAAQLTPEQTETAERLIRELPRPGGKHGRHHGRG